MNYLDLFAGIGGFALGAYNAGWRFERHYFSEIDPWCCKLYARRFPDAVPLGDIREIDGELLYLDMMSGFGYSSAMEADMAGKFKKMTEEKVTEAIAMYQRGLSLADIGAFYGVSRQSIWDVLRRRIDLRAHLKYGGENHFYRGGIKSDSHVHDITEKAIKRGVLHPQPCEMCGEEYRFKDGRLAVQAHHDDYNKPLEVRWLCQKCHHAWHKTNSPTRRTREPAQVIVTGGFP